MIYVTCMSHIPVKSRPHFPIVFAARAVDAELAQWKLSFSTFRLPKEQRSANSPPCHAQRRVSKLHRFHTYFKLVQNIDLHTCNRSTDDMLREILCKDCGKPGHLLEVFASFSPQGVKPSYVDIVYISRMDHK